MGVFRTSGKSRHFSNLPRTRVPRGGLRSLFEQLLRDEGGQSIVEYVLILSATVVGAGFMGRSVLKALDEGILRLGSQLEKDLKTGRSGLDIWKN